LKLVFSVAAALVLGPLLVLPATADGSTTTVSAYVQPVLIAISVSPAQVDYQTLEFGVNDARPTPTSFRITNNGSVPVDLEIKGDDSRNQSDNQVAWLLGATPGNETYAHRFTLNTNSPTLSDFNALTKSFQAFMQDLAVNASQNVVLSLGMPTQSTKLGRQVMPVTVRAIQATP